MGRTHPYRAAPHVTHTHTHTHVTPVKTDLMRHLIGERLRSSGTAGRSSRRRRDHRPGGDDHAARELTTWLTAWGGDFRLGGDFRFRRAGVARLGEGGAGRLGGAVTLVGVTLVGVTLVGVTLMALDASE